MPWRSTLLRGSGIRRRLVVGTAGKGDVLVRWSGLGTLHLTKPQAITILSTWRICGHRLGVTTCENYLPGFYILAFVATNLAYQWHDNPLMNEA
jgi:hypothetical protein